MNDYDLRTVLVVDDEPNIVSAIQRELYAPPFGYYDYEVEGFTDPAKALERAAEFSFDAVISDYRMPGMNGLEFLKALALIQPDCARIVLSGHTDMNALSRLVNESHIYRFIPKPWSSQHLKLSLAQAIDYSAVLVERKRILKLAAERNIHLPHTEAVAVDQVLIVDDELGVLNALSRILPHRMADDDLAQAIRSEETNRTGSTPTESRIGIQVTPSPLHALKLLETNEFSCIIADYRMSEMNGLELLAKFAAAQPDCARMLISGQIDQDTLTRAINDAHIFAFIDKPWSEFELKSNVLLAISRHRMLRENRRSAGLVG